MNSFIALILNRMAVLKQKRKYHTIHQGITTRDSREFHKTKREEIRRIETFSDAVFAFSISLLVMSLEVPQTFNELKIILQTFLPFIATVSLVFLFWYQQYRYFRSYGLNNKPVIFLNAALLVLILFYIYPLKFLFSLLFNMIIPGDYFPKATANGLTIITNADFYSLVMIYSAGYAAIWLVFYFLYHHAYTKRKELELMPMEIQETYRQIRGALVNVGVGVSALIFSMAGFPMIGGICYLLILPLLLWNDWYYRKQCRQYK